ncbi:MAG: dienelactone hydrolase family protein [Chloroflexota bacterium]|nr:dienelactone hydrolase family protein [Chloroflexota bacterium]MDE3101681.1 dienelactone hydrolase family protein [Chloroflexota bacterium]
MRYEGMIAETVGLRGHGGVEVASYTARPLGPGPFPGLVVVHHAPGWDDWCKEVTRRFAHRGYAATCPNLYAREGEGDADDIGARVRAAGGVPDDQVMGDLQAATDFLRAQAYSSGTVGVIGFCSGGRHTYLAACTLEGLTAAVDCWGGGVVVDDPSQITPKRPVAPVDLTPKLKVPLLGIFGNEDKNPTPDQVDRTEAALKKAGKDYAFHRYDGAGHAFVWTVRPSYRLDQALDAWGKIDDFLARHLS